MISEIIYLYLKRFLHCADRALRFNVHVVFRDFEHCQLVGCKEILHGLHRLRAWPEGGIELILRDPLVIRAGTLLILLFDQLVQFDLVLQVQPDRNRNHSGRVSRAEIFGVLDKSRSVLRYFYVPSTCQAGDAEDKHRQNQS